MFYFLFQSHPPAGAKLPVEDGSITPKTIVEAVNKGFARGEKDFGIIAAVSSAVSVEKMNGHTRSSIFATNSEVDGWWESMWPAMKQAAYPLQEKKMVLRFLNNDFV